MTASSNGTGSNRRIAAIAALVMVVVTLVLALIAVRGDIGRIILLPVLILLAAGGAWVAATRHDVVRIVGAVVAVLAIAMAAIAVLTAEKRGFEFLIVVALVLISSGLTRYALRRDVSSLKAAPVPGTPVGPARQGVLIMNLKSGGGKAERFALDDECRRRGIEPVVLQPGDDLLQLARDAIERGADVIGMAGGDGSQALVASVVMAHDLQMVCIPAGTRNHFALDLGLDRDDVVGALDAFGNAVERRVDLAEVSGRVFVNNVSLGVYAKIVQSPDYRDAKRQTTSTMLPELLGPDAPPFDLRFVDGDGLEQHGAQMILVANNPYALTSLGGFGTRERMDSGQLGVTAAEVHGAADVAAFVASELAGRLDRFSGWTEWAAPTFTVESNGPVEAGVDGEALLLDPPLEFRSLPGALRVRLPNHAPGYSPAALKPRSVWWSITELVRVAAGRQLDHPESESG